MHLRVNANKLKPFRIIGGITLALGICSILLFFANLETRMHGGRDLSTALRVGLLASGLSICVILLYRWAIVLISSCYLFLGLWLIIGSIVHVPFPVSLVNVIFGIPCLLPIIWLLVALEKQNNAE